MNNTVKYRVEFQIRDSSLLKDGTRIVGYEEVEFIKTNSKSMIDLVVRGIKQKAFDQFRNKLLHSSEFKKELETKGFQNPDCAKCCITKIVEI